MFILQRELLKSGDIILTKSDNNLSRFIQEKSNSEYSHARLYLGNTGYVDSDGHGVQANNVQRLVFNSASDVIVLRLIDSNNQSIVKKIELFARQKIGTSYSKTEAFTSIKENPDISLANDNRQFCTRFVAQSYHAAGIDIVKDHNYPTPKDIQNSNLLEAVHGVVRQATPSEIELAQSESPLRTQIEIHNSIFKAAREISQQDIQTFEQLHQLIIDYPEFDHQLTEVLKKSGYLYMAENDFKINPWFYDSKTFLERFQSYEVRAKVINEFREIELPINGGLIQTISGMEQEIEKNNREFLREQQKLNEKLKKFSDMRMKTIREVEKHL